MSRQIAGTPHAIGVIHRRYDGSYEATVVGQNLQTITDAFENEKNAKIFIKTTYLKRFTK